MSPPESRPELEAVSRRDFEEVWGKENLDAIPEIYRDDYRGNGFPVVGRITRGGYRRLVETFLGAFSDVEFTVHELTSRGDLVYTRWSFSATHTGSVCGIPPSETDVVVEGRGRHRYEGQKVAETWLDFDWRGLFAQIGGGYLRSVRP